MQILMTFILLVMICFSLFYIILNIVSSLFDRILDTKENENDESDVNSIL
jgi:hypothetical protein